MAIQSFTSFDAVKSELVRNSNFQQEFKNDPIKAMDQIQINPLNDIWIYRVIVLALGITIILIILGVIVLMGIGEIEGDAGVPTILTAIGSAAIGALAGLLAPAPKGG